MKSPSTLPASQKGEEPYSPLPTTPRGETEGSRPRRDPRILSATGLERVKDAKRLALTKLQGLEDSIARLEAQSRWIRQFGEAHMTLQREKKHLFSLGKQKATMAREAAMLERYDLLEGIHGTYQRLSVVKEQIGKDKRGLQTLQREADESRQKRAEQEKREQQQRERLGNATLALTDALDRVSAALLLTGENQQADTDEAFLLGQASKIKEETDALSSLISEKERTTATLEAGLEQLRGRRQGMKVHENMLRHGETVLLLLRFLADREKHRNKLQQIRGQAIRRQNEENELLGKAFSQFRDIVSKSETAEAELGMHRSYIQGQDGLMLQERALELKGRRLQLLSALSLWKRISTGYESIEEKSRKVTALRLGIQHLEREVRELETETGKAQRLCKEKEYTYFLSKGQDIIQLRADLREGVSCPVCGQAHHPYHSDTILDQSKLIGEMKTDYELLAAEANAGKKRLSEMQAELATRRGRLNAEEEALNTIRIRQREDIQEWNLYARLDPTFTECSESTNLEARTTLLRQFIENVSRDAELAEKELETFTFHQARIASIGEELQGLEQKKSEVNVRLGELNTGCQVLSREVEQTGMQLENINKQCTRIYKNLQEEITIGDWYTLFTRNPEQLCEQIQKLTSDWFSTEEEIAAKQAALDTERARLEGMRTLLLSLENTASVITKQREDLSRRKEENLKAYRQLIPEHDAKSLLLKHMENVRTVRECLEEERSRTADIRRMNDIMQGRHDYYLAHIARLEAEQKELGEHLDLWMHAFNLQHPPVQQGELDELFADGKDWSKIRSSLKQIDTDMLLCQAKVDDLNSRIIALETEDGHCSPATPDMQESIAEKGHILTRQRNETLMQIARLSVQLEDHERALAAERNSAEPTRALT